MLKNLKISGFSPMRSGAGGAAVKVINTILQKQTRKTNNPTNNTLTDSRRLYAKYTPSQYNHTRSNYNNGEYNTAKCCDKSYNTNIQTDGGGCCYGRVQSDDGYVFGVRRLAGYLQRSDGFFVGNETTNRPCRGGTRGQKRGFASASAGSKRTERANKHFVWPVCSGTILWSIN